MLSIIIPYHSSRSDNLKQTLRFLNNREKDFECEIILICQDHDKNEYNSKFQIVQYNLKLDIYHKNKMINFAVNQAKGDRILLLDSDRILPFHYIYDLNIKAEKKHIYTIKNHIMLSKKYSDEDINNLKIDFKMDIRIPFPSINGKNMFSGNTYMYKEDFINMGKADEDYIGYGFADNDCCFRANKIGLIECFEDGIEMHLNHPPSTCVNNKMEENREAWLVINALRFACKNSKPIDRITANSLSNIEKLELNELLKNELQKCKQEYFVRFVQKT